MTKQRDHMQSGSAPDYSVLSAGAGILMGRALAACVLEVLQRRASSTGATPLLRNRVRLFCEQTFGVTTNCNQVVLTPPTAKLRAAQRLCSCSAIWISGCIGWQTRHQL